MRKILNLLTVAAVLVLASSCVIDNHGGGGDTGKAGAAEVILRLKTPGGFSSPGSRSLTNAQENTIDNIYVLVFDKDNKLTAIRQGENVTYAVGSSDPQYSGTGSFSVTLEPSKMISDKYNLVVLANAASILSSTIGTNVSAIGDKSYSTVTAAIWAQISGKMYPAGGTVPMWGESGHIIIEPGSANQSLTLTRSVARIDVGVGRVSYNSGTSGYSWDGKDSGGNTIPFALSEVYVVRPNNRYAVIPNAALLGAGNPTVPSGTSAFTVSASESAFAFAAAGGFTSRDIYVPEADVQKGALGKPGDANHENRMAVVVGGSYNGGGTTYYRLDFAKNGSLMNVLRNHLYQFNISSVSGAGYPDVETAYKSLSMNITADILEWDEIDMGTIVFNGQNYMSISPTEFDLPRNAKTGLEFAVKTDYAQGWTFAGVTDSPIGGTAATWIKNVSPISGAGNDTKQTVTFDVDLNDFGVERTAYIHVKAGDRLTFPVRVTQSTAMETGVKVLNAAGTNEITELVFESSGMSPAQPAAQPFMLRWAPDTESVAISTAPAGGSAAFVFDASSTLNASTAVTTSTTGEQSYTVRPAAFGDLSSNPFAERKSVVNFTLSAGGQNITQELILRHINYNLITDAAENYFLGAQTETINVRANFGWRISAVTDTGNILQNESALIGITGGNNTAAGDPVSFTMQPEDINTSKWGKTATITFTSLSDGSTYTVTITAVEALYVGMFGGALVETNGVWQFERGLYMQHAEEASVKWYSGGAIMAGVSDVVDGRTNTFKMYGLSTDFAAAAACYQKNDNYNSITSASQLTWYLPAQKQLMAVWVSYYSFDSNYKPGSFNYWSATELNGSLAYFINMLSGRTYDSIVGLKSTGAKVRCVREL